MRSLPAREQAAASSRRNWRRRDGTSLFSNEVRGSRRSATLKHAIRGRPAPEMCPSVPTRAKYAPSGGGDRDKITPAVHPRAAFHGTLPAMVGGGSVFYGAMAWRFRPETFRLRSLPGAVPGANLEDWPLTYDDLEPYYEKAEYGLGVSGDENPHGPPRRKPQAARTQRGSAAVHGRAVRRAVEGGGLGFRRRAANRRGIGSRNLHASTGQLPHGERRQVVRHGPHRAGSRRAERLHR